MAERRKLLIVAIVLLTAGLLITTGWSVMADIVPAPVIVPAGIYTGVIPMPPQFTFTTVGIPVDPAGNKMICIMRNDHHDPTLGATEGPASEADQLTDLVLSMVRTAPNAWAYTGVAYGMKTAVGQTQPEILYVEVVGGTVTSSEDGNALTVEGTSAYYLPEQDTDEDGFPDADQEPIHCAPHAFAMTRMPMTPPCVPIPVPEGE